MLTQPQIDKIKQHPGWGWITALKSVAIRSLVTQGALQRSLLDEPRRKKKPLKAAEIALQVGKVLGHYKVGKHFEYTIGEGSLPWKRREEAIQQEAKLDGIYVIRTSESKEHLS